MVRQSHPYSDRKTGKWGMWTFLVFGTDKTSFTMQFRSITFPHLSFANYELAIKLHFGGACICAYEYIWVEKYKKRQKGAHFG